MYNLEKLGRSCRKFGRTRERERERGKELGIGRFKERKEEKNGNRRGGDLIVFEGLRKQGGLSLEEF